MPIYSRAAGIAIALGALAACGSSRVDAEAAAAIDAPAAVDAAQAKLISNTSYAAKMARQSSDDVALHSDLSEMATTGTNDGDGTRGATAHGQGGFTMQLPNGFDYGNIGADFNGNMAFANVVNGGLRLNGQCDLRVHPHGNQNYTVVLDFNTTQTLANGDVIVAATQPNVTIGKVGGRMLGTVTRTVNGTVERKLTSPVDSNRNFDLIIEHQGVRVTDAYTMNGSLATRSIDGTSNVQDVLNNVTSTVVYAQLQRGLPGRCVCPTGGTITQTVTQQGVSETHTYAFGGECGASTVSVDGNVAVAAAGTVSPAMQPSGPTTGSAYSEVHVHAQAKLAWDQCIPPTSD